MSTIRSYLPESINNQIMYYAGVARYCVQPYISNTFSANQITQNIYIGDIASAFNNEAMKEQGITHIISIYNGAWATYADEFVYKIIHVNDDTWVDIGEYFDETNIFIEEVLSDPSNKILIHCQCGVSRSVTLLAAYLLWKENYHNKIELDELDTKINNIIKFIQEKRAVANPNDGFISCLKKYICFINSYQIG